MATAAKTKEEIIDVISNMTVLELSELVKELEAKFGVSAAMPMMAGPAVDQAPKEEVEEKTEFDVILAGFGENKIQVIKEIRTITALGLKEAKELVEGVPQPVKKGVTKEEAEEIKKKLEASGATVEIK
ncbi:MAG: 50S ribosomal protein L7/L12 [bacterium]|nr:50S ribosomal protein L7/L12 [bacterium]